MPNALLSYVQSHFKGGAERFSVNTCEVAFASKRNSKLSLVQLIWFDSNLMVDCRSKSLFAAEILFGGLDAHMPKQKLDLLQFAASYMTQPGASSPAVMRRDLAEICFQRKASHHMPDHLFRDSIAPRVALPGDGSE